MDLALATAGYLIWVTFRVLLMLRMVVEKSWPKRGRQWPKNKPREGEVLSTAGARKGHAGARGITGPAMEEKHLPRQEEEDGGRRRRRQTPAASGPGDRTGLSLPSALAAPDAGGQT